MSPLTSIPVAIALAEKARQTIEELTAERDELRKVLKESYWCVEYMAGGMTHAAWVTKKAQEVKITMDKVL